LLLRERKWSCGIAAKKYFTRESRELRMTHDEIVNDYILRYREAARQEMRDFESESSLSAAIRRAALCELRNGKRHLHQRRIPRRVLEQVEMRLQRIEPRLAKATDFAAIHRSVDQEVGGLKGIGALTVYDISHRIGAYLGKSPKRVYLHAGTRIGAQVFGIESDPFEPGILPKPFAQLTPAEVEDCLCIYKDDLKGISSGRGHRHSGCVIASRQLRCSM
jgi:hypothetical protein